MIFSANVSFSYYFATLIELYWIYLHYGTISALLVTEIELVAVFDLARNDKLFDEITY